MPLQLFQRWAFLRFLFHLAVVVSVSTVHVRGFAPSATPTAATRSRTRPLPLPLLLAQNKNNNNDNNANNDIDKGFNLLGIASKVVPQGRIVQTAKESWKFVWKVRLKLRVRVSDSHSVSSRRWNGMEWNGMEWNEWLVFYEYSILIITHCFHLLYSIQYQYPYQYN
jgi:hypothetical protein